MMDEDLRIERARDRKARIDADRASLPPPDVEGALPVYLRRVSSDGPAPPSGTTTPLIHRGYIDPITDEMIEDGIEPDYFPVVVLGRPLQADVTTQFGPYLARLIDGRWVVQTRYTLMRLRITVKWPDGLFGGQARVLQYTGSPPVGNLFSGVAFSYAEGIPSGIPPVLYAHDVTKTFDLPLVTQVGDILNFRFVQLQANGTLIPPIKFGTATVDFEGAHITFYFDGPGNYA